jgi:hypothetical protein
MDVLTRHAGAKGLVFLVRELVGGGIARGGTAMVSESANRLRSLGLVVLGTVLALVPTMMAGRSPSGAAQPSSGHATAAITIRGVDLHDGQIIEQGGTYYFYGTMYAPDATGSNCTSSFVWRDPESQWCGFGVSTARSLAGPWSTPTVLVSNTTEDFAIGQTFENACMGNDGAFARPDGEGCFEPRMYRQTWGNDEWTLWFNVPNDQTDRGETGIFRMSCTGPAGPCNPQEWDIPVFSGGCADEATGLQVVAHDNTAVLFCATIDQTLAETQLGGSGVASASDLGGLTSVESPGVYYDRALKAWVLTYSSPNCGYCARTGTGFATDGTSHLTGDDAWAVLATSVPPTDQLETSTTSCGGQPGGVDMLSGRAYEQVDLWAGTSWGEAGSPTRLEPLGGRTIESAPTACPSVRLSGKETRDAEGKGAGGRQQSLRVVNGPKGRS